MLLTKSSLWIVFTLALAGGWYLHLAGGAKDSNKINIAQYQGNTQSIIAKSEAQALNPSSNQLAENE